MKKSLIYLSKPLILLVILFSFKVITNALQIGAELPKANIKLLDINGNKISMKEAQKPNGLLVMFSCNTCPFVVRNQQRTKAICKYALQNNIGVILLNSNEGQRNDDDSFKAMKEYAKQQNYEWYYAVDKDNEIADAFGAKRTPECFLFNKDFRLSYHGAIDDNPGDDENVTNHYLKEAINNLISGKEIAVKESRSVGCAIKRKEF